jgi:hypothetical protein
MGRKLSLAAVAAAAVLVQGHQAVSQGKALPYKNLEEFVQAVNSHFKVDLFDRDVAARLDEGKRAELARKVRAAALQVPVAAAAKPGNVKVNQDRNPWPKAEIAAAVDPTNGANYLVMENDFRENVDHMFWHVSTDGGKKWTDDSMTVGLDDFTGGAPFNFQSDPGLAFDSKGHSVLSTITGNFIFDFTGGSINMDSQIEVAVGFNHGTYASLIPIAVDTQPCSFTFTGSNCAIQLDKPFVAVDNVPGSPRNGTVYVFYTAFCVQGTPCTDGAATIPPFSSAILEAHAPSAGAPFSPPNLVSGTFTQTQFSSLVVDSKGRPHIFFDDFTNFPAGVMLESSFDGENWTVHGTPVATFQFNTIGSLNWFFRLFGTVAPGCGIHKDTAYCAFAANKVNGGPVETSLSVYLASVNTANASTKISRVNNDVFNGSKDHFFPWATAKADGSVYVGWYDDRKDPFNTKVEYFVGKSTDGGKTFPVQKAVSDVSFNPCDGFPFCSFFGDYTQLASGPDGVVHAAWSDTRDGASMQIFSQAVTF